MFDSVFNYIIFLIPLAIFIGRLVVQARGKHEAPQNIPVHFEDDDESEYFKGLNPPEVQTPGLAGAQTPVSPPQARAVKRVTRSQLVNPQLVNPQINVPVPEPVVMETISHRAAPGKENFTLNLNHLSPLKQAVIMAEVLGPPKGLI